MTSQPADSILEIASSDFSLISLSSANQSRSQIIPGRSAFKFSYQLSLGLGNEKIPNSGPIQLSMSRLLHQFY